SQTDYVCVCVLLFFNVTWKTRSFTLSLHDALPIWVNDQLAQQERERQRQKAEHEERVQQAREAEQEREKETLREVARLKAAKKRDRKSTRLNSSHVKISYAVFCLKKKIESTLQDLV